MESFAAASRFIEDVSVITPLAGRPIDLLPDGRTTVVLRVLDGGRSDVSAAGPRTRAKFKSSEGLVRAIVMQFKPGWSSPLLGVPARELTDRIVLLKDLWGGAADSLREELVDARGVAEIVACFARALAKRPAAESSSARLARRAARMLAEDELRVDSVAARLGVTARHLRRAFIESIGIGPKEFARTVRLQRVVRMAQTSTDWGRIASAAGYYDQAHLIGDFRDLVGLTPGAFAKRASPR